MLVRLLSGQVLSHFDELWLTWSHGGGITSGMSYMAIAMGQWVLGAAPSRKAVWWDLRLASLLTHLCSFKVYSQVGTPQSCKFCVRNKLKLECWQMTYVSVPNLRVVFVLCEVPTVASL